ncbi:MAG: S6e family ribosomal protein [Nanoarchaeota archaeon]
MPFKINIGTKKGSTYKLEIESEDLIGKSLHDKIAGKDISPSLEGYEFEITGTSDKAGFTSMKNVEGIGLKKVLLTYGKGMKKRPRKEGKKKRPEDRPKGLRLRKTVRGKVISPEIVQINLKLLKEGAKKLSEIFPEQNKAPEKPVEEKPESEKSVETPKQEITKEKEKSQDKEIAQPDKEPTSEEKKE